MAKLNGECGGTFSGNVTHSPVYREEVVDGSITTVKEYPLIKTLATALIEEFTDLASADIDVTDIPETLDNLVRWTAQNPM
jgi:hypothetical protein